MLECEWYVLMTLKHFLSNFDRKTFTKVESVMRVVSLNCSLYYKTNKNTPIKGHSFGGSG